MSFGDNDRLHYTWNNDDQEIWNNANQDTWTWTSGPVIPENKWAMVAIAIESSKATAYVGTEADGLQKGVNNLPHIQQRIGNVLIGFDEKRWSAQDRYFCGLIDDVRIYSYALNKAEIEELYAGRGPGPSERPE